LHTLPPAPAAAGLDGNPLAVLVVVYLLWDGASETVYSLASAHAGDRAGKDELLALSSSLLFAWSLSGFVVPALVTGLSAFYGTRTYHRVGGDRARLRPLRRLPEASGTEPTGRPIVVPAMGGVGAVS